MAFVKQVAERALDFTEGNVASPKDAQSDFTPDGWKSFLKQVEISPDDEGAPQFSSALTASETASLLAIREELSGLALPAFSNRVMDPQLRTIEW